MKNRMKYSFYYYQSGERYKSRSFDTPEERDAEFKKMRRKGIKVEEPVAYEDTAEWKDPSC